MTNTDANELDRQDPLASKRKEFILPDDVVYLDGNSLGPLSIKAKERAAEVVNQQWGSDLITSWNKHQWIDLPQQVGSKIARLIGAEPHEVICCDSTSINLFKVLSLALKLNPDRTKILSQTDNFPTDLYMAEGLQDLLGQSRCELVHTSAEHISENLNDDVAVLFLTQVNFRTGAIHDIEELTQQAHEKGILVIWDLAHSAGVIPLDLTNWGVDFAIGCGYKYLNGGPGAPAFVYAATKYHTTLMQPLTGWMGHAQPFAFSPSYAPAQNMKQFLSGTPTIVSMSILDAALDVYRDLDIEQIRTKSLTMTEYFATQISTGEVFKELAPVSPMAESERGSQLSFQHPDAYAICQAWIDAGVIADFRDPDILRVGFAPLYLSYADLDIALHKLAEILVNKTYLRDQFQQRKAVT